MSPSRTSISLIQPLFTPNPTGKNSPQIASIIRALSLQGHLEGGYFNETDRAPDTVPSPFPSKPSNTSLFTPQRPGFDPALRGSSTTIFYLLTPNVPQGGFCQMEYIKGNNNILICLIIIELKVILPRIHASEWEYIWEIKGYTP
jgi:hypothetical protein